MIEHTELGVIYNSVFMGDVFIPKSKIQELSVGESVRYYDTWSDYLEKESFMNDQGFVEFKIVYKDLHGVVILITEEYSLMVEYNHRYSTYYSL